MSERAFRKRNIPATTRSKAPPPTGHKIDPKRRRKWRSSSEDAGVLKRSDSEPSFAVPAAAGDENEAVLYQTRTCMDVFSPPEDLGSQSPWKRPQVYNMDAKVVVNVTVEGSVGPIRAMIKLGSKVEDAIKLVIDKYNEEGRTPRLDKDVATTCELHHSYFSLQCLKRSDLMGEVGSRSFYLRKGSVDKSRSEAVPTSLSRPPALPFSFLPGFIGHKMRKFIRITWKLWELMCCIR